MTSEDGSPLRLVDIAGQFALFYATLYCPTGLLRLSLLVASVLAFVTYPLTHASSNPPENYAVGVQGFALSLILVDRVICAPRADKHRVVSREGDPLHRYAGATPPAGAELWTCQRALWALLQPYSGFMASGVRRAQGRDQRTVEQAKRTSRVRRLSSTAACIALTYLTLDLSVAYMRPVPYFHGGVPFTSLPLEEQVTNTLMAMLAAWSVLLLLWSVFSLGMLALPFIDPGLWPDFYGSPRGLTSLRGFWGQYWHPVFRHAFTGPPLALLDIMGLNPRGSSERLFVLVSAFALSGALHAYAQYIMSGGGELAALFFLAQPMLLAVEQGASFVSRRLKLSPPRRLKNAFGLLWTTVALGATATLFIDDFVQGGMFKVDPVPYSLVRPLLKFLQS